MRILLCVGVLAILAITAQHPIATQAAPALQLPWPIGLQYRINGGNTYGCDTHTNTAVNYFGIDFQFQTIGDQVTATAAGTVTVASIGSNQGAGNYVVVDHGSGYTSRYLHLRSTTPWPSSIYVGAAVSQGQVVGYSGNTPNVAAHLHFDMQLYVGGSSSAYKPERMSNVPALGASGFGWYGFSVESGLGCGSNGHDPSPSWTSVTPSWHGWTDWGPYADKSPIAVSYSDDRIDHTHLAARTGSDIFVRSWTGTAWQAWSNISSNPADPVFNGNVAVSNHYGRIYVIAAASNYIWLKYWDGSAWIGWQDLSLGSPITGSIAVSYGTNGRIDVIGVASNKAWHKYYNGTWNGWFDLSGTSAITGSVAVANRGGLIHVVGYSGGKAWLKWWNGNGWYGWQDLVSPIDGSLAIDNTNAIAGNTGSTHYSVHVVAMAGGNAWLRCWDNSDDCNPTGWLSLGGPLAGPLAVTNQNAQIRVVAKDSGSKLWHKWRG